MRKQFAFVQALPLSRSRRKHELEQAKARCHAARVVHKRAKDADQGYQQLIKHLLGPHRGALVPSQLNEGFPKDLVNIFSDNMATMMISSGYTRKLSYSRS
jgi:hypothetical protein